MYVYIYRGMRGWEDFPRVEYLSESLAKQPATVIVTSFVVNFASEGMMKRCNNCIIFRQRTVMDIHVTICIWNARKYNIVVVVVVVNDEPTSPPSVLGEVFALNVVWGKRRNKRYIGSGNGGGGWGGICALANMAVL